VSTHPSKRTAHARNLRRKEKHRPRVRGVDLRATKFGKHVESCDGCLVVGCAPKKLCAVGEKLWLSLVDRVTR
jgi:hypothetical protein